MVVSTAAMTSAVCAWGISFLGALRTMRVPREYNYRTDMVGLGLGLGFEFGTAVSMFAYFEKLLISDRASFSLLTFFKCMLKYRPTY